MDARIEDIKKAIQAIKTDVLLESMGLPDKEETLMEEVYTKLSEAYQLLTDYKRNESEQA